MERVVPDVFSILNLEGMDRQYHVNAKYDRLDVFPWLSHWVVKVYDDNEGLVNISVEEATAHKIIYMTGLPLVVRDSMFNSEHEAYIQAQAAHLEGLW